MQTLSVRLRYRPLQIGWCVRAGDFDAFRWAIRMTHTMWGGRFNPIIVIEEPVADALIRLFRVDALYPASSGEAVKEFIARYPYLPWPLLDDELFSGDEDQQNPAVVDIVHPMARLHKEHIKNNPAPTIGFDLVTWDDADPLRDTFLINYGGVPDEEEIKIDYSALATRLLNGRAVTIPADSVLPPQGVERIFFASLNSAFLDEHYAVRNHWNRPGFYVGLSDDFSDLITYWNLRATHIDLTFVDQRFPARFDAMRTARTARVLDSLDERNRRAGVGLWHRRSFEIRDDFDAPLSKYSVDEASWNGLNIKAPIMYFGSGASLASIDEEGTSPRITFQVVGQPFEPTYSSDEHYVLSVDPGVGLFGNERATLHAPFLPRLNEFYGRELYYFWNTIRAEPDSIGIITSTHQTDFTLKSLAVSALISEVFGLVGIEASPSRAGLIGASLIRQMGGLNNCRPFKIAGVRKLIEDHRPDQAFSRSDAMQTIRGADTDRPLAGYQWLYIEPRRAGTDLTNDAVLGYLLDRGVFRAGLQFGCPSCQLVFWLSLDDARGQLQCEYCGHSFNAGRQLRDKGWAFRRSGLFGREGQQEGSIPVTLTLQQLIRGPMHEEMYVTGMDLNPNGADIRLCETDFVVLSKKGYDNRLQLVIGECKTRQPITDDDVQNLKRVADAFPAEEFDVFIVFAKLSPFESDEIERIRAVNDVPHSRRAIMFTDRELESYFPYSETAKEFELDRVGGSLKEMAKATVIVFFEHRRRPEAVT